MKNISDKLIAWGAETLTNEELLALLVEDEALGEALSRNYGGSLASMFGEKVERLRMVEGLGRQRAVRLVATAELGRRVAVEKGLGVEIVNGVDDLVAFFRPQLKGLTHEECWVVYLTASNRIIDRICVSTGGVGATVVDLRLVVKPALELLASQLVLVHNHPSGAAEPSSQDKVLTEKVAQAAALFDIRLLDHLIITREGYFSFRAAKLIL